MELHRVDYTMLGLTGKNCTKLLPVENNKYTQKIVVGDQEGIVQIFFIKRGEIQITFKSLPNSPITNVILGGSIGSTQDKIFVSYDNIVRGYTKKGKPFLNFETQLLEPIKSIHICGNDLIVAGIHNYHHYYDCKLIDSFNCNDVINDIITLNVAKVRRTTAVLACADHMLRTLDGSTITQSLQLPSSPTCLYLMNGDGGTTGDQVLVGLKEGQIYLVQITRSSSTIIKWILEDAKNKSEITCITMFDFFKTGMQDVIVGRHDGNVELYTMMQSDEVTNEFTPPVKKFSYAGNESVTSLQGGYVANTNFEEILITTYSGWLFGLTTEAPEKQITNKSTDLMFGFSREERQKIMKLKADIEELESKLTKEREKYSVLTQEDSAGILRLPYLTIDDKITLQKDDATYSLVLESENNIDYVLIQCNIPIELLDIDKNMAFMSYSKCDPNDENALLATYRCQSNTVRLEVKFHAEEGQRGTLNAYVTPCVQPKCCQLRQFSIQPLSLHCRIHSTSSSHRFYNELILKGTFSVAEMHRWVIQILPELPEKPPDENTIVYCFKSTLVDTVLECAYSRGEARFKSDNISTIAVLKDILSKEAIKKNIKLEINSNIDERSVTSTLKLLDTKIDKYFHLNRQFELIEALKEIDAGESERLADVLIPQYKQILENESEIRTTLSQRPRYLERLQSAVINLFLDWHKFKGMNVRPKLTALSQVLHDQYSFQNVIQFFSL